MTITSPASHVAATTANSDRERRETAALEQVARRLHEKFPNVAVQRIEATVDGQFHRFDNSRIRDFVPIFVERFAREELLALAS